MISRGDIIPFYNTTEDLPKTLSLVWFNNSCHPLPFRSISPLSGLVKFIMMFHSGCSQVVFYFSSCLPPHP